MFGIPRRYSHFIFGVIQAGLTSLIAAGIASFPSPNPVQFFSHWLSSWLVAWIAILPVVVLAAPAIRAISVALTRYVRRVSGDVRFWPKADMSLCAAHVRYRG